MNTEVNLHPSSELLNQFIQGELATGRSVVISAHVELCKTCSEKTKELQALAVSSWVDPDSSESSIRKTAGDYSAMIQNIVKEEQIKTEQLPELVTASLGLLDSSISLPRVLAKAAAKGLVWKKVAGGISEAQLPLDNETQCGFIYMAPGCQVPVHTHEGSETTLVLDGSFEDELGKYRAFDFIIRDQNHQHQPISKEGCLCFAVLDSPLTFTSGLARLMNPINRYRFRKAISKYA